MENILVTEKDLDSVKLNFLTRTSFGRNYINRHIWQKLKVTDEIKIPAGETSLLQFSHLLFIADMLGKKDEFLEMIKTNRPISFYTERYERSPIPVGYDFGGPEFKALLAIMRIISDEDIDYNKIFEPVLQRTVFSVKNNNKRAIAHRYILDLEIDYEKLENITDKKERAYLINSSKVFLTEQFTHTYNGLFILNFTFSRFQEEVERYLSDLCEREEERYLERVNSLNGFVLECPEELIDELNRLK